MQVVSESVTNWPSGSGSTIQYSRSWFVRTFTDPENWAIRYRWEQKYAQTIFTLTDLESLDLCLTRLLHDVKISASSLGLIPAPPPPSSMTLSARKSASDTLASVGLPIADPTSPSQLWDWRRERLRSAQSSRRLFLRAFTLLQNDIVHFSWKKE